MSDIIIYITLLLVWYIAIPYLYDLIDYIIDICKIEKDEYIFTVMTTVFLFGTIIIFMILPAILKEII